MPKFRKSFYCCFVILFGGFERWMCRLFYIVVLWDRGCSVGVWGMYHNAQLCKHSFGKTPARFLLSRVFLLLNSELKTLAETISAGVLAWEGSSSNTRAVCKTFGLLLRGLFRTWFVTYFVSF